MLKGHLSPQSGVNTANTGFALALHNVGLVVRNNLGTGHSTTDSNEFPRTSHRHGRLTKFALVARVLAIASAARCGRATRSPVHAVDGAWVTGAV